VLRQEAIVAKYPQVNPGNFGVVTIDFRIFALDRLPTVASRLPAATRGFPAGLEITGRLG